MTSRYHLGCFPEGHRSVKPYMLPLKKGMIRYAYERELLVQPILLFGMETAMNEYTLRMEWKSQSLVEYYISDVIDPKDYKPGSKSQIPENKRTLEAFHQDIERTLYTKFEKNHELVSPENNRVKYLREGEETILYNKAKVGEKSYAMKEYALAKRKNKRN